MTFRFTLSHPVAGELQISPPDGWEEAELVLERHPDFHSLVEDFEGNFIFYGTNGTVNGGIDFIREIESTYGFDEDITITIEQSFNGVSYTTIFTGLLDIPSSEVLLDNKMQVPIIQSSLWATFINRLNTPVDINSNTTLDSTSADVFDSIRLNMTYQTLRKKADHRLEEDITYIFNTGPGEIYAVLDWGMDILDELEEKFNYPRVTSTTVPFEIYAMEDTGNYVFDVKISAGRFVDGVSDAYVGVSSEMEIYFQKNNETPIALTKTDITYNGNEYTTYTYNGSHNDIIKGDMFTIYAECNFTLSVEFFKDGLTEGFESTFFPDLSFDNYFKITADTTYINTDADAELIHDLCYKIIERITSEQNIFYSDFLGGITTNCRQYFENGCGWMYATVKGLQIRRYTLEEKPFFLSFKQCWEGINPILNLGLGYETLEDSPEIDVIRAEQKADFYDEEISVNFSNVREISRVYDDDCIFKTVKVGYKKWQSEDISGIDDPQTKKTYALPFKKVGKELVIESEFIAASLAIETTRRTTREKSADYKYDNETFIIALNEDDVSPDYYVPELDENFGSVTNLLNSETRYNLILTPARNFFRWANYVGMCVQSYLTSKYRFTSGEGNFDMASDYDCGASGACRAIICNDISEKQDLNLATYGAGFGYLHRPELFTMKVPMQLEDYETIRNNRKKAIGISQTDENHAVFFIKELSYNPRIGQATIKAWPKEEFTIQVISQDYNTPGCIERSL